MTNTFLSETLLAIHLKVVRSNVRSNSVLSSLCPSTHRRSSIFHVLTLLYDSFPPPSLELLTRVTSTQPSALFTDKTTTNSVCRELYTSYYSYSPDITRKLGFFFLPGLVTLAMTSTLSSAVKISFCII